MQKISRTISFLIFLSIFIISGCRPNGADATDGVNMAPDNNVTVKVKITAPEPAELWEPGSVHYIEWELSHEILLINIELYKKGEYRLTIAEEIASGNGSYRWKVPEEIPGSRHYRIKISNSLKPAEYAFGNYFYILR